MSLVKSIVPANLTSLWRQEDAVISWSLQVIAEPERAYLMEHLELVETYMDCVDQVRQKAPSGDYHRAYMGLFLRSFDALSRCVRSALSGPVAYLCRSECSFRPLGVRKPRGFCLPMLSADGAGYRSR
jgi:hypothetical protein